MKSGLNLLYQLAPAYFKVYLRVYTEYFHNRETINSNGALKNKYHGQTCYILTNGPSLLEHDLTKLSDKHTFALNHFSLHPQYKEIHPKFYTALDPVIFSRPLLFKHFYPNIKKANWKDTHFFVSVSAKTHIEENKLFPGNPIHYLVGLPSSHSKLDDFNLAKFSQYIDSSPAFVLLLANYLGFKKIYILGSDFRDFLTGESHFYPNFRKSESDPFLLDHQPVANRAIIMAQILNNFKYIGDYLKTKGVQIFNATPGYLDVFPYVEYRKILK